MKDISLLKNEDGSVMIVALILLVLLTVLGIAAIQTSSTEVQIAANDNSYLLAFYSAEAARGFVEGTSALYGDANLTPTAPVPFPNNADPSERFVLSPLQSFNGTVQYNGGSNPPRASGYAVGTFRAHGYVMAATGFGPRNSQARIAARFYRIGF
jgi:hypothetical protein